MPRLAFFAGSRPPSRLFFVCGLRIVRVGNLNDLEVAWFQRNGRLAATTYVNPYRFPVSHASVL
jgi:hypothetical protein